MILNDITVKKCGLCKQYFIPTHKSQKYCDRIYQSNKTCKDIGYSKKIEDDIFLKLYRKAYKTKHAQMVNNTKVKYKSDRLKNKYEKLREKYEDAIYKWREENKPKILEYHRKYDSLTNEKDKQDLIREFEEILNKSLEV